MLPDSTMDSARGRDNPYMFADTGIPRLIEMLLQRGASRRRLVVNAIGGAQILDPQNVFEIGKRNYLAARRILWKAGLLRHAEAVGGMQSRTMKLEVGTGRVLLSENGVERELLPQLLRTEEASGIPRTDRR